MSKVNSIKIPVQPIYGAEPFMCSVNVQKRIKAMGGRAVFGWLIRHDPHIVVRVSHCVWEDQSGQLWDVTPECVSVEGVMAMIEWPKETEFERDDTAAFEGKSHPTRYASIHPSPHVARACEFMGRADVFLRQGDLDRCRYWTERANKEVAKAKLPFRWDTPASTSVEDVLATVVPQKP
jgi:hypothetical protein